MIDKNLALILGILFLVSFVVAETTTPATTGTQQGVSVTFDKETGTKTYADNSNQNVFLTVPRGFEVSESSPNADTWGGMGGTLTGKVYTLKNTGLGAKQGDSTTVKFGNSEVDVPLSSTLDFYRDKEGNFYISRQAGEHPLNIKTASGTFEKIQPSNFKLDKNGEVLIADFVAPKDSDVTNRPPYKFKTLGGKEIKIDAPNWGNEARIHFDAEKNKVAFSSFSGPSKGDFLNFYDGSFYEGGGSVEKSSIALVSGPYCYFAADLDENGQMAKGEILNGKYHHTDSEGISRSFHMYNEGTNTQSFNILRENRDYNWELPTVYLGGKEGSSISGFINGPITMEFDSRADELEGYSYEGFSQKSSLDFRTGNEGQQILVANQDFTIRGLTNPELIMINQGGYIRWGTSGVTTDVPLDIYYGNMGGSYLSEGGGVIKIRTSTNPLQTENVQIALTSSTTAQNQQQQVTQNSIWTRILQVKNLLLKK